MAKKGVNFGTALMASFIGLVIITVAATNWVSLRFGEQAVTETASQLEAEIGQRISAETDAYLAQAAVVTSQIQNGVQSGAVDGGDLRSQQRFHCRTIQDVPSLKFLAFADAAGQYVGYERKDDRLIYTIIDEEVDPSMRWAGEDYYVDDECEIGEFIEPYGPYDATTRGWYSDAVDAQGGARWSPTFLSFGPEQFLIISNSTAIVDDDDELLGVATSSVSLGGISEFLADLEIGDTGEAFIVESTGGLVATSTDDAVWGEVEDPDNPGTFQPAQMTVQAAENPLIQLALEDLPGMSLFDVSEPVSVRASGDAGNAFVRVAPYSSGDGIDWFIVTVIPEDDFLGSITDSRRQAVGLTALALLAAFGVTWLLSRWLVRPISRTISAAEAISRGDLDVELSDRGPAEVGRLARAFNRMSHQLEGSITDLEFGAFHDELTGLPNRAALVRAVQTMNDQGNLDHAMLFLDADGFKLINDSLGHHVGDRLLMVVAERIQAAAPAGSTCARIGGDEFCVLVPSATQAANLAEQLQRDLQAPFSVDGHTLHMSASIGIANASGVQTQPTDLIRDADIAMYSAKTSPTTDIAIFDNSMRLQTMSRLQLENDLRLALDDRQLAIAYQPIVDLRSGRVAGFEALVRWNHPHLGPIPPTDFIPVAEECGLIGALGAQVIDMTCIQIAEWQRDPEMRAIGFVSVNVSSLQLKSVRFASTVEAILSTHGVDPVQLRMEITESALVDDSGVVADQLSRISGLGVGLTIDDFGTGYSAMNYLYRFNFTTLKIDRSFVTDAAYMPERRLITEAVSALAQSLHMSVIAEGIEQQQQRDFLISIECDQGQGWLFSRALWPDEARTFAVDSWQAAAPTPTPS